MTTTKLEPETERRLRERMEGDYARAKEATAEYMAILKVLLGDRATDPLLLDMIDSYSTAKAKEILAFRTLEGCGWAK